MPLRLTILYFFLVVVFFLTIGVVFLKRDTPTSISDLSIHPNLPAVLAAQIPQEINIEIKALPISEQKGKSSPKTNKVVQNPSLEEGYFLHTNIRATYFYVGEPADSSNGYIPNSQSAWDGDWLNHFGGVDHPENRIGLLPAGFVPKENPFYVALPYFDFENNGGLKESVKTVPWFIQGSNFKSQLKNRWVKIIFEGKIVYAQWQDVGPFETDDFDYVFGTAAPKNTTGLKAGIDVSPAVRYFLGSSGSFLVSWQFVEEKNVPTGPWKDIVTISDVSW